MKKYYDNDIVYKINNASYVILDIMGFWNIHIDKDKNEIFQENQYHLNRYSDSETTTKDGSDTIGSLFYLICKSCLTYESFKKWERYVNNVLTDTHTAYKDIVFE